MNCRKVNSQLSAYMDAELSQREMEAVREHLRFCSACRLEHETLLQTKRAVASLANRVSREEIARLLADTEPVTRSPLPLNWKISPMAATVFLSLAGLWLATSSLDSPRDWHQSAMLPDYMPASPGIAAMTPMLSSMPGTVTVGSPVTVYTMTSDGELLNRTTFRSVNYRSAPHSPSFREVLRRLFGRGASRSNSAAPNLMMAGYDNGPMPSISPMVRVFNDHDEMPPTGGLLLQGSTVTGRFTVH